MVALCVCHGRSGGMQLPPGRESAWTLRHRSEVGISWILRQWHAALTHRLVQSILRSFGALLGFAMLALSLTGPAAAWDQHVVTHISAPVAVDEHHHHDDDGSIEVPGDGSGSSRHDRNDRDGGHDHMPSLLAAVSDLPPEGPVFPIHVSEGDRLIPAPARVPPDLPPAPQIRPPRFA